MVERSGTPSSERLIPVLTFDGEHVCDIRVQDLDRQLATERFLLFLDSDCHTYLVHKPDRT